MLMAIIGAAIQFVGVFTPIVSVPILGNLNYFLNGKGDGTIILGLSVATLVLAFVKKFKDLYITGGASLCVMAYTGFNFLRGIQEMRRSLDKDLDGNPFKGLGELAINAVQLQWGWALLVVGTLLVLASAYYGQEEDSPPENAKGRLQTIRLCCIGVALAPVILLALQKYREMEANPGSVGSRSSEISSPFSPKPVEAQDAPNPPPETLQPGETSNPTAPPPPDVVPNPPAPEAPSQRGSIDDLDIVSDSSKSTILGKVITGVVANRGSKDFSYVSVEVTVYDDEGNQVGTTFANTSNLEAYGRWSFETLPVSDRATRYKITRIRGW